MPEQYLDANQSRVGPANPYELKLAGALSEIFASGSHELSAIISGVEQSGPERPRTVNRGTKPDSVPKCDDWESRK